MKKIIFFSLYCFNSFPIRIFHNLARREGVDPVSIFLKNSSANNHKPLTQKELDICIELVAREKPDLIGISTLAPYVVTSQQLIARLKEVTDAPIVVGGKYPTLKTEEALELGEYVCKGEGELVLEAIIEHMKQGKDLTGITGLWHKDAEGNVVDMGQQILIQDLDSIPHPAHGEPDMYFVEDDEITDIDPEATKTDIMVMAGRGCVYKCTYCVNAILLPMSQGLGKFMRPRTPDSIIREIEERVALLPPDQQKHAEIEFVDEVFGVNKTWTKEFVELYVKRVGLPFSCEMVPKMIKEENIKLLATAGLCKLNFGIQSGDEEIRNGLFARPGDDVEHLEKAKILIDYGIQPKYDLILENPFESEEMIRNSLKLLMQLPGKIYMNVFKLQFFPGYPITEEALKRNIITERELTHEYVAKTTMTNWSFRPKMISTDSRDVYHSAILLLALNDGPSTRRICKLLIAMPWPPITWFVKFFSYYIYNYYRNQSGLWRNLRRAGIALNLIKSGRFKELTGRIQKVYRPA